MKKEERTIQKIEDDVKSAGQTFLGMRMGDLLCRIPELDDKERKKDLIQEYYENQIGTYDKDFSGTRIRVNAAARIIRGDKVIYALLQFGSPVTVFSIQELNSFWSTDNNI